MEKNSNDLSLNITQVNPIVLRSGDSLVINLNGNPQQTFRCLGGVLKVTSVATVKDNAETKHTLLIGDYVE